MTAPNHAFADIAVLAPVGGLLTYSLSEAQRAGAARARRVVVPLGRRRAVGFIVRVHGDPPPAAVTPKPVETLLDEGPFFPEPLFQSLLWAAGYYLHPPGEVIRAALPPGASELPRPTRPRRRKATEAPVFSGEPQPGHPLTPEQQTAAAPIALAIERGGFAPFLLHGVTGSGKTEIYLAASEQALARGLGAVV
ncbi:MAG: primosomal protein N' family DNA-binding protein, partial [Deltaproteobacteria bacterium]